MKKLILCLSVLSFFNFSNAPVSAQEEYFAKVDTSGIYFYSTMDESGKLFELPSSYYVRLTGKADNTFYSASYMDKIGYVKINEVKPINGTPKNPYATASFRVFDIEGLGLYKSPKLTDEQIITTVPYLTSTLSYYGKIEGDSIPNKSNYWYYCKFTGAEGTYQGYLYSVFCDQLSSIPINNENFPFITGEIFDTKLTQASPLSDTAKTFIIIGVSLPCALLIYLLIKPTISGQIKIKHKKTRKRHRDYFEFDENDLA